MKISIQIEISPDETELANEIVATLRQLTADVSVKQVREDLNRKVEEGRLEHRPIIFALETSARSPQSLPPHLSPYAPILPLQRGKEFFRALRFLCIPRCSPRLFAMIPSLSPPYSFALCYTDNHRLF